MTNPLEKAPNESATNISRLGEIRDQDDNKQAAVSAIEALENLAPRPPLWRRFYESWTIWLGFAEALIGGALDFIALLLPVLSGPEAQQALESAIGPTPFVFKFLGFLTLVCRMRGIIKESRL